MGNPVYTKKGDALTLAIFFALKSAKSSQIIINIFQQMQFETFCSLNICNLCLYSGAKNIKLRLPIISNSSRRFKLRKPDYMQLFKYFLDESKCQHFSLVYFKVPSYSENQKTLK